MLDILVGTIVAILVGAGRSFFGWLENALRDGIITKYELRQLAGTMAFYILSINVASFALPMEYAVLLTFGLDIIRTVLKSLAPPENSS